MSTRIHFFNEDVSYRLQDKRKLAAWVKNAIESEKLIAGEINVILCSDEHLLKVNNDFLKHDYYTDIITFDYSKLPEVNGDLYISIERVKDNARKFEVNLTNELYRVIIHGVMHLCGYKDKKKTEVVLMRKVEAKYLRTLTRMQKNSST